MDEFIFTHKLLQVAHIKISRVMMADSRSTLAHGSEEDLNRPIEIRYLCQCFHAIEITKFHVPNVGNCNLPLDSQPSRVQQFSNTYDFIFVFVADVANNVVHEYHGDHIECKRVKYLLPVKVAKSKDPYHQECAHDPS